MQPTGTARNDLSLPATITVDHAARVLRISENTARQAVDTGRIPVLRLGPRTLRVSTARLAELLGCTADELAQQIAATESAGDAA